MNTTEINIKGNGTSITCGDITPSLADHTDFGEADVSGGTIIRTFTVENLGGRILALLGSPRVALSGSQSSDFEVVAQPSSSVGTNSYTTFQVRFDPSDSGSRQATISIENGDANENPLHFFYCRDRQGGGHCAIQSLFLLCAGGYVECPAST
jgi:hypothetical protein